MNGPKAGRLVTFLLSCGSGDVFFSFPDVDSNFISFLFLPFSLRFVESKVGRCLVIFVFFFLSI